KEIMEEERMLVVHTHEFLMLSEKLSEEKAWKALKDEYGEVKEGKIRKAVEILREFRIVNPK
ncbi:DUF4910 domain-containing protein, partial [Thermococci archaeon]